MLTAFGAQPDDTGEILVGDVDVTVVLLESTGAESTEDWTQSAIDAVKGRINEGLKYWKDMLAEVTTHHSLNFDVNFAFADDPFEVSVEPISRRSNDYTIYVDEFLDAQGFDSNNGISDRIRAFNHAQREASGADWAFTMFVVNNENDLDKLFLQGGSFRRAFAFAGGRFVILPADRPNYIIAHEVGHMFWARDEYVNGGDYDDRRGYYDTQNLNAHDKPVQSGPQVNSIMANGQLVIDAYADLTSSPSSLAMVGWQDSDGDGIIDVLDVDHLLTGDGYLDPQTSEYHFVGRAEVQTLPNRNSSGLQNDLTTNEVDLVQYRVNGQQWTTVATPGTAQADIDIRVPIPADQFTHTVEIQTHTIDPGTGQTIASSPIHSVTTDTIATVARAGVSGFVWQDGDADGTWDAGEGGAPQWVVQLVDDNGQQLPGATVVEPDDFGEFQSLNSPAPGVTLSAIGADVQDSTVRSRVSNDTSTGTRVFAVRRANGFDTTDWTTKSRNLKVEFASPVSLVRLDAVGNGNGDVGRLDAFDVNGNLIARYTTGNLSDSQVETMMVASGDSLISSVIAKGHMEVDIQFDNLRVGADTSATTNSNGVYQLNYLQAGTYNVQVVAQQGLVFTTPSTRVVELTTGEVETNHAFGVGDPIPPAWQNEANPLDVNGDGSVSPVDALQIINRLNTIGPGELPPVDEDNSPPPFYDVNGDGNSSPVDALIVINFLNSVGDAEAAGESDDSLAAVGAVGAVSTEAPSGPIFRALPLAADDAEGEAVADLVQPAHRADQFLIDWGQSQAGDWAPEQVRRDDILESDESDGLTLLDLLAQDLS